jgi:CTP synthase
MGRGDEFAGNLCAVTCNSPGTLHDTLLMKYIFFTGGVVSSLGKGLTAASLGTLLERRGLKVVFQKFDPYLNVDPGTMSPYQHGEVYVLDDGAETDLDLGHYERFTSGNLSKLNNITSGQVYETVLSNERKGVYLGETVQVIPHVTNVIKERIQAVGKTQGADVIITEIGGTVGDIEGLPFLEAIRQFAHEVGRENILFVHVTLVPYIKAAGELKTKPTQQSVAKLREIGIQPHIIICRSEEPVEKDVRDKIALFCNVEPRAVLEARDVKNTIYELPLLLHGEHFDDIVCEYLKLNTHQPDLTSWQAFVDRIVNPTHKVRIAVVGKYIELQDAYKSVYEALTHAGAANDCFIRVVRVDAEDLAHEDASKILAGCHGILIPGGFGDRGTEGKIAAARYAREHNIPYLGLCLGMQIATIDFARHACGMTGANSTEFDKETAYPVIHLLDEQKDVTEKGASMRLGTWKTKFAPGSLAERLYGKPEVNERHRHRFEFNNDYRAQMEEKGLRITGTSPNGDLVEVVEVVGHPFFIACQYHPEFLSKPNAPHPLFRGFVAACLNTKV